LEQNPSDLAMIADYVTLNALMVPRPLHLIYNTEDTCCFVASTVKANTYEPVIPFYKQAGVPGRLSYYENSDPGTHNYDRDNREQLYAFLKKHFVPDAKWSTAEIPSEDEILSHEALNVELPKNNADFHSLAAGIAKDLPRPLGGTRRDQREHLRTTLRFEDDVIAKQTSVAKSIGGKLRVESRVLRSGRGWNIPVRIVESKDLPADAANILYFSDTGSMDKAKLTAMAESAKRVIAVDPVLLGQNTPSGILYQHAMLVATVGERALAIQVAQVLAVAREFGGAVEVQCSGPRSSLIARCAAAIDGGTLIESVKAENEPESLKQFIAASGDYSVTPEAYCFGLLQHFDVPQLKELAKKGP